MNKKPKFASIESLDNSELEALFELICKEIIFKTPKEVRKEMFGLESKLFKSDKVEIAEIMTLINLYDIKFELKLTYLPALSEPRTEPPIKVEGQGSVTEEAMKEQGKVVKEPFVAGPITPVVEKKEEVDENSLPDF